MPRLQINKPFKRVQLYVDVIITVVEKINVLCNNVFIIILTTEKTSVYNLFLYSRELSTRARVAHVKMYHFRFISCIK